MEIYNRRGNHFKHCIVSEEEFMNGLYVNEDYDFLSIRKKDYYAFLHVTPSKNKESIIQNGLLINYSNTDVHLGEGVYGVNISYDIPDDVLNYYIYNFNVFLSNAFCTNPKLELTLFVGHQACDTEFCTNGEDNHSGFLVFKEDIKPSSLIYNISLNKDSYKELLSMNSIRRYQDKIEEDCLKEV